MVSELYSVANYLIVALILQLVVSNQPASIKSKEINYDDDLVRLVKELLESLKADRRGAANNNEGQAQDDRSKHIDYLIPKDDSFDNTTFQSCGRPHTRTAIDKRIMGGHPANPHSWPWQIRLLKRSRTSNSFNDICGGAIISPRHILTAAHCVWDVVKNKKDSDSNFLVIAGDHDRETDEDGTTQSTLVDVISVHPHYNSTRSRNDIAILFLTELLDFNENVSSCCLSSKQPTEGELCYATGWGNTEKGLSEVLREVKLPIFSTSNCRSKFYGHLVGETVFCAGYEGGIKDTCQGDSGGPLVCPREDVWVLCGITSWGVGCGLPNKPGVYTKVSSYLDWIQSVTGVVSNESP